MEFSASQIAALVSGKVEGDGNVTVSTFAKIEEGHPGAISFLANPKYTHFIYSTKSSIVLVSNDFVPEEPISCTLIRVADPYATVAFLLDMVSKMTAVQPEGVEQPSYVAEGVEIAADCYVGAFAYVGKGAVIGKNVKIYPQVYVGAGAVIGDNTILYPGVKIYHGCKIGKNCILHSGVVIGSDGFGFAPVNGEYNKIPQLGIVELEDNVEIGANTTIDRAMMGATKIRHGVKLDNLIQIAHNCEVGANTVMAAQAGVAGSTKIGAGCMVGGQVGFAGHIHVGDGSEIGAQSGIPNDVKPGSRLMGYPAVNAGEFARQAVYTKNLGKLFDRVKNIEKELNK
ncbi:UDP-3-O-(3-hydroxymyristoyl)glucosamine N-acyltransferase [uncultured Muribaculum sp.]|uniref:UDP-3-O-(3-hydroxymyristoyl)glucosamine N-acyltransferase n=1 Tax=uncultured Muribaculum sp. TaxID=1918613 RepID=UPI0025997257|nr:UDP-3-O-(3-hydroxymyristoyl)glucosamine N-acyltransferase [uncultured Muribaculum sp.]